MNGDWQEHGAEPQSICELNRQKKQQLFGDSERIRKVF